MPLYSFKCEKCLSTKTLLKKMDESVTPILCQEKGCDGSMHRIFDQENTSFILKGNWFKTSGKY